MSAGTLDKTAPSIEVRVYRHDRLVIRERCQDEKQAAGIAAQATDLDHVYLLVDDGIPDLGPGDVFPQDDPFLDDDQDKPLALHQLAGYGVE
jgi:hypothetical protein